MSLQDARDGETRGNSTSRGGQRMRNEMADIGGMSGVVSGSDRSQSWFALAQDSWSLPFATSDLDMESPGDLDAGIAASWATDRGERTPAESALPPPVTGQTPLLFAADNAQALRSNGPTSSAEYQGNGAAPSASSQSPAPSGSSHEGHTPDLPNILRKDPAAIRSCIEVYFLEVQPIWPILHAPSFDTTQAPDVLLGSMVMLVRWLKSDPDHAHLTTLVFDAMTKTLLV